MLITIFKALKLVVELEEVVPTWHSFKVNIQEGFESLLAVDSFVHGGEMQGIALLDHVLLREDLAIPLDDIR